MDTTFLKCFVALFGMAFVWFGLIIWVFHRLRTRHPAVYDSIGAPTLFWNNSIRNNCLFLAFLFGSRPRELQDAALTRTCVVMRIWLVSYVLLFVATIYLMP